MHNPLRYFPRIHSPNDDDINKYIKYQFIIIMSKMKNRFVVYLWDQMDKGLSVRNHWVVNWLFVGVVMVLVQILLGGVTRLTGSGLSITRWDIVMGTIPPLNQADWQAAFELYKQTPQYQHINAGMEMGQFKFIFFWEYVHRLWARTMGFVFLIPFVYFLYKKQLSAPTLRRLGIVVALAALAAIFGWIMVASGLINRPWVNAYKLTIHLGLGISLFSYLFYTWMAERGIQKIQVSRGWKKAIHFLIGMAIVQICFGGFVSGMKSSLNYPTWPDMNGRWIPAVVLDSNHWTADAVLLYDQSGFMPALVQVIHRNLAYILLTCVIWFVLRWMRTQAAEYRWMAFMLLGIIVVQVTLGILVLLGSVGSIPVFYGALHQVIGISLLTMLVYFKIRTEAVG